MATTDARSHDRTACALFRRSSTSKLSLPARANARYQVEDVRAELREQWYGGPGRASRAGGPREYRCGLPPPRAVWCGPDRRGGRPPGGDGPEWAIRPVLAGPRVGAWQTP